MKNTGLKVGAKVLYIDAILEFFFIIKFFMEPFSQKSSKTLWKTFFLKVYWKNIFFDLLRYQSITWGLVWFSCRICQQQIDIVIYSGSF